MEITGINEAAQFMNVLISGAGTMTNAGVQVAKVAGSLAHFTGHQIKALIKFLAATIKVQNASLHPGEMRIDKLMNLCDKNKNQVGVMSINNDLKDDFIQYCNKNGLTYSMLVDVNTTDDRFEAAYSSNQALMFEKYMREHGEDALPYSFKEYVDNATPDRVLEAESILSPELQKENILSTPEELNKFKAAESVIKEAESKNELLSFDKRQLVGINENIHEFALLDATGRHFYIDIPNDAIKEIEDGKLSALFSNNREYEVFNTLGFGKKNDGNYVDLTKNRQGESFMCSLDLVKDISKNKAEKYKSIEKSGKTKNFINTKADNKIVSFTEKTTQKVSKVADKVSSYKPSVPKR